MLLPLKPHRHHGQLNILTNSVVDLGFQLYGTCEEWVSSRIWPQCEPCPRGATVLLSGRIHLSQTNGGVKLSLFIYPSSPESSIFQLEAAGERLWREVCDPMTPVAPQPTVRQELILKIQTESLKSARSKTSVIVSTVQNAHTPPHVYTH